SLRLLEERLHPLFIGRGDCVVRQGEDADALYVVVSGRFAVEIEGQAEPVAEISHGSTIGEIAFFAGGARTATVGAIRDGVVVGLTRADFDEISSRSPAIWTAVTATLAERLAAATRRATQGNRDAHTVRAQPRPRTIALLGAGGAQIPPTFLTAFLEVARTRRERLVVSSGTIADALDGRSGGDLDLTEALNALESRYSTVVFVSERELTPWSEKSVRQADELLMVAAPLDGPIGTTVALSPLEAFALSLHRPASRRLVIVHGRKSIVQGTRHWLALREPAM